MSTAGRTGDTQHMHPVNGHSVLPAVGTDDGEPERLSVATIIPRPAVAERLLSGLRADFRFLDAESMPDADVLLIITDSMNETVLCHLEDVLTRTAPEQVATLVTGPVKTHQLLRLVRSGVVSVLPYAGVTASQVARALIASHSGRSILPQLAVRWLVDEIRVAQHDLFAANGLAPGGLTAREVEVLRLLADGADTAEIAARLRFSERTIKKVIQHVITRLGLRNRAHAVAYAMRVGAI
jgi:DNA-binding NarL/FixJ family response regulator